MNPFAIQAALTALFCFSALSTVASVGKPRDPFTGRQAVASLVLGALIVWGVWSL